MLIFSSMFSAFKAKTWKLKAADCRLTLCAAQVDITRKRRREPKKWSKEEETTHRNQSRSKSLSPTPILSPSDFAQNVDNHGTQEVSNPCVGRKECCPYALHVIRSLVIEKLQHAHAPENLNP